MDRYFFVPHRMRHPSDPTEFFGTYSRTTYQQPAEHPSPANQMFGFHRLFHWWLCVDTGCLAAAKFHSRQEFGYSCRQHHPRRHRYCHKPVHLSARASPNDQNSRKLLFQPVPEHSSQPLQIASWRHPE